MDFSFVKEPDGNIFYRGYDGDLLLVLIQLRNINDIDSVIARGKELEEEYEDSKLIDNSVKPIILDVDVDDLNKRIKNKKEK